MPKYIIYWFNIFTAALNSATVDFPHKNLWTKFSKSFGVLAAKAASISNPSIFSSYSLLNFKLSLK